jgi:hypothetical protein
MFPWTVCALVSKYQHNGGTLVTTHMTTQHQPRTPMTTSNPRCHHEAHLSPPANRRCSNLFLLRLVTARRLPTYRPSSSG